MRFEPEQAPGAYQGAPEEREREGGWFRNGGALDAAFDWIDVDADYLSLDEIAELDLDSLEHDVVARGGGECQDIE